jgi:Crp-like helix-turn-helix domain/AAA ATPase domain
MVTGDAVNSAARIQAVAGPGTVLVDATTHGLARATVAFADAGEHLLKGKARPMVLYQALGVVAGAGGADRPDGGDAQMVGRDPELRLVKEQFHTAVERSSARLLAVSGEAGVGKSRLRWEFEKYVDGLPATVLWHTGRCLSDGDGVAFWALAEMVRQRFGIAETDPAELAETKLNATAGRWLLSTADRELILPGLRVLLGLAEGRFTRERTASVCAVDEVTIRALRRDSFEEPRRSVNDFLMHLLAARADRLSRLVHEAYHVPVEQRVARRLLEVGRLFAAEGLPVVVPVTPEEVAQLAGTRRPTANQILRGFQDAGLLRLVRGRVELLDIAGLRQRCRLQVDAPAVRT